MQYEKHKFMRTGRLSCKLLSVSELITEVKVILITNKWVKAIRYYFSLLKRQLPVHYLYTPYGTLSSLLTIYLFVLGSHPLSSFIKALIASSLSSIISVRSCNVSLSFSSHTNVSHQWKSQKYYSRWGSFPRSPTEVITVHGSGVSLVGGTVRNY